MTVLYAAVDGNTLGLGGLSSALVIAMGYMLRDRRDTDKRVDKANAVIVETLISERDREIKGRHEDRIAHDRERHELRVQLDRLAVERDDALDRVRILQLRLGLQGDTE